MLRELISIIAAILLSNPSMSKEEAHRYAVVIREEAKEHNLDPFDIVALVHNESHWHPHVVNSVGCVGLGQICPPCPGGSCSAMLDGVTNLRTVASAFAINRDFCRKKVGTTKFQYWIQSYGGFNHPSRGMLCGHKKVKGKWKPLPIPKLVKRILDRRKMLVKKYR